MAFQLKTLCMAVCLLLPSLLLADEAQKKSPPPDAPALKAAVKQVNEVFQAELAAAKTPAQKAAVVNQLLEAAKGEKDPAARFVLLTKIKDITIESGDASDCQAALDSLEEFFDVDALKIRSDTYLALTRTIHTPTERKKLADDLSAAIQSAILAERFDVARLMAETAQTNARPGNDATLVKRATTDLQTVREAQNAYTDVKKFLLILADKPSDPEANLKVGKYRCFITADWKGGLPLLALASDPTIKVLAQKEIAGPSTPEEQVKLAEGWWDLANAPPAPMNNPMAAHAVDWYRQALPTLSGLAKSKAELRIKTITLAL